MNKNLKIKVEDKTKEMACIMANDMKSPFGRVYWKTILVVTTWIVKTTANKMVAISAPTTMN